MGEPKDNTCPFINPDHNLAECFIGKRTPRACQSTGRDYATDCSQFRIIITETFEVRCVNCNNLRMNGKQKEFRWIEPSFIVPKEIRRAMPAVICPDCQPKSQTTKVRE